MRIYLSVTAATFDAALACGADAWIVDLVHEDLGALGGRLGALAPDEGPTLTYRIAASGEPDLPAISLPRPAAILVPAEHGRDIAQAGAMLAVHEAEQGWPDGGTGIVALVARAVGALNLASFAGASPRLVGIGWDAAALADELGMAHAEVAGAPDSPLAQVRSLVRLAAAAARVKAIEAACPPGVGVRPHAERALRDGFGGVFAQAPDEVAAIRSIQPKPAR